MQKGWVLVLHDIFSIQKSIQAISELLLPITVANTHVIKSSERLPQLLRPTSHCIYHSYSSFTSAFEMKIRIRYTS